MEIVSNEFNELESLYKEGMNPVQREELTSALKGKSNISNYLREILQNAEKEVIICTDAEDINSKIKVFQQTIELLKKSNIKLKIALSGDDILIKRVSDLLDVKIKKVNIDTKFFIVDRKEMLFYLTKGKDAEDVAGTLARAVKRWEEQSR